MVNTWCITRSPVLCCWPTSRHRGVLLLLNSQVVLQHLGHAECRRPLWNEFWLKVEHNFYTLAAQVFWNHRQIVKKYYIFNNWQLHRAGGFKSSRSSDWLESEPSSPVVFEGIGRDRQGQYWQTWSTLYTVQGVMHCTVSALQDRRRRKGDLMVDEIRVQINLLRLGGKLDTIFRAACSCPCVQAGMFHDLVIIIFWRPTQRTKMIDWVGKNMMMSVGFSKFPSLTLTLHPLAASHSQWGAGVWITNSKLWDLANKLCYPAPAHQRHLPTKENSSDWS